MNREEAKNLYIPKSTYHMKMAFVDKIFDDFESRICGNCQHWLIKDGFNDVDCTKTDRDFGCNKFKRKEND